MPDPTAISRRTLLLGAAAVAPALARSTPIRAYAGTYSSPQGPEGSKGNGRGIVLFEMNPLSGALEKRDVFEDGTNPSWLAIHPSKQYLYAANEVSNGTVTAYSIAAPSGGLQKLNSVSSEGDGPAHLSVHPSGKYVFVANYYSGTFAVLPIQPDGRVANATDVKRDTGTVGSKYASSAPAGSFAISGHDRTHAHMIESDPSGKFILGSDLGMDRIHVWKFNPDQGTLDATGLAPAVIPDGDGPRHFVFHPNRRWLYSLQEEASTLIRFDYDANIGKLSRQQQISTLPKEFAGTNFTSEVRISKDGRFLYAANRLHDTIAWLSIDPTGDLTLLGEMSTRGDYPRSFTIDPTGKFLYCCNQRGDAITCFRVNDETGALSFTGQYTAIGTPSIIVFAD